MMSTRLLPGVAVVAVVTVLQDPGRNRYGYTHSTLFCLGVVKNRYNRNNRTPAVATPALVGRGAPATHGRDLPIGATRD